MCLRSFLTLTESRLVGMPRLSRWFAFGLLFLASCNVDEKGGELRELGGTGSLHSFVASRPQDVRINYAWSRDGDSLGNLVWRQKSETIRWDLLPTGTEAASEGVIEYVDRISDAVIAPNIRGCDWVAAEDQSAIVNCNELVVSGANRFLRKALESNIGQSARADTILGRPVTCVDLQSTRLTGEVCFDTSSGVLLSLRDASNLEVLEAIEVSTDPTKISFPRSLSFEPLASGGNARVHIEELGLPSEVAVVPVSR
jgi:hypothetical protein